MNECLIKFFKWSVWKMNKQGLHLSNPNIPKERRTSIMSASSKTIHTLFSVLNGQIRSRSEEVVDVLLSTLGTLSTRTGEEDGDVWRTGKTGSTSPSSA